MSDFPKMMFRKGGPYKGGYSVDSAADADEYEAMTSQGWSASKDVALGRKEIVEAKVKEAGDELRAALEAEAKKLGVSFNSRTSDKVLEERLAEARG
jgi:hypothetical protein